MIPGQPLSDDRPKSQLVESGLSVAIELTHVSTEAEWLTLLPPRKAGEEPVECDRLGRAIVTNGAVVAWDLPTGYKEKTCVECVDVMGGPTADLGSNGRFLVSGVCSAQAAFVIACRSGILRLERNQGPVARLVGHTFLMYDLKPLAVLLDRLDVLLNLNQEGEPGLLVATWEMMHNNHEQDADLFSWMAGIDRWRWILASGFPRQLFGFASQWEESRQGDIQALREIHRQNEAEGGGQ